MPCRPAATGSASAPWSAVQPEGGDNWLLGVVRRYVRTGPNEDSVGIETISKAPRAVLADAGGLYTEALLLDVPEVGEYARMALPANALEDKVALVFTIDDKNARLHPRECCPPDRTSSSPTSSSSLIPEAWAGSPTWAGRP
jgi:hypothetical protein